MYRNGGNSCYKETRDMWLKYHFSICERMDLIRTTNPALDILVKNIVNL